MPFRRPGKARNPADAALADAPEQVNQDPYGAGWIFLLELADPAEVDALMDAAAYRQMVEEA